MGCASWSRHHDGWTITARGRVLPLPWFLPGIDSVVGKAGESEY